MRAYNIVLLRNYNSESCEHEPVQNLKATQELDVSHGIASAPPYERAIPAVAADPIHGFFKHRDTAECRGGMRVQVGERVAN